MYLVIQITHINSCVFLHCVEKIWSFVFWLECIMKSLIEIRWLKFMQVYLKLKYFQKNLETSDWLLQLTSQLEVSKIKIGLPKIQIIIWFNRLRLYSYIDLAIMNKTSKVHSCQSCFSSWIFLITLVSVSYSMPPFIENSFGIFFENSSTLVLHGCIHKYLFSW